MGHLARLASDGKRKIARDRKTADDQRFGLVGASIRIPLAAGQRQRGRRRRSAQERASV
jgi:hypothetical protein